MEPLWQFYKLITVLTDCEQPLIADDRRRYQKNLTNLNHLQTSGQSLVRVNTSLLGSTKVQNGRQEGYSFNHVHSSPGQPLLRFHSLGSPLSLWLFASIVMLPSTSSFFGSSTIATPPFGHRHVERHVDSRCSPTVQRPWPVTCLGFELLSFS